MPLTRTTVTAASRVMLPTYPVLAGAVGLNYLVRGDQLLSAGVIYRTADHIMPLELWGVMFLLVALVQVVALVVHNRFGYQTSLALMAGAMTVWAVVGVMAAVREGGSYTAALWPGFVVVACIASFRSLNAMEV